MYDDLQAVLNLERRMAQVYPNVTRRADQATKKQNTGSISPHATFLNGNGSGTNALGPSTSMRNINNNNNSNPTDHKPQDFERARNDDRDRERERGQRHPSPSRRDVSAGPSRREPLVLKPILQRFMAQLPPADRWDGPMLHTKNLIESLRDTVIISGNKSRNSPPPPLQSAPLPALPPTRSGRPSPDYGPYQGPNSMRPHGNRRRY
ncbi:CFIA complex component [Mycena chlorophos]|uniref:CFIA complex component n=1 Tax=Mycena chlorophos TaxID=658473 RepID=A0A8H6T9C9_MYCCL|nr:CFIA complex component [Mycena chlorophos]